MDRAGRFYGPGSGTGSRRICAGSTRRTTTLPGSPGDQLIRVDLNHPIPVFIVYGEAIPRESGEVSFLFRPLTGATARWKGRLYG